MNDLLYRFVRIVITRKSGILYGSVTLGLVKRRDFLEHIPVLCSTGVVEGKKEMRYSSVGKGLMIRA